MNQSKSYDNLATSIAHLTRIEPRFDRIVQDHGMPSLRRMPPGVESLLRIVTDQLISLKAGEAIWRRLHQTYSPFGPEQITRFNLPELREQGLSGAKARTFLAIADVSRTGLFEHETMNQLSDSEILSTLMKIPGIGPWTANIYLLSAMGRTDAWPSGDLALQVALQHLLGLDERPNSKQMRVFAEPWQPHRSTAARLLWSHYRGLKRMPQVSI